MRRIRFHVEAAMTARATRNPVSPNGFVCDPPQACMGCLAASSLAEELTPGQIKKLYDAVSIHRLAAGEVLVTEDHYDDHLYAVVRGEFEAARRDGGDRDIPLARLPHGTVTDELAFLDRRRRTATVKAATDDACAIGLKPDGLEWLLRTDPDLVYHVMKAILRAAHKTKLWATWMQRPAIS